MIILAAFAAIAIGATVTIIALQEASPPPVPMPNVIGLSGDDATRTLRAKRLSVSMVPTEDDSYSPCTGLPALGAGPVVSQSPDADHVVPEGTRVLIYVDCLSPTPTPAHSSTVTPTKAASSLTAAYVESPANVAV